jgi:endonuclease/exonuclease/phosphatase family metal-dependent hydrolase
MRLPLLLPASPLRTALFGALLLAGGLILSACGTSAPSIQRPAAATVLPDDYAYPDHDSVRVATWNVEHFVDQYDNPYVEHPREDEPDDDMAGRVDRFVEAVRALDADVLVLQEFESEAFAQRLAERRFPEMGYRFFASTESPTWYMNVVVLSRLPLGVLRSYADVTTPIAGADTLEGSDAQRLTNHRMWMVDVLARPDYAFALTGLHLKAGGGPRNRGWRLGQVRLLHTEFSRLEARRPDANLMVAGDLNMTPDSPEMRRLLHATDADVPSEDDALYRMRLVDPLAGRPTLTHPSDDPTRQLDYILTNQAMQPELVDGATRVARPLSRDQMPEVSDHLPVVTTVVARER